ncbi:unnamed protein product [Linum trigynum]|uniref:Secreted protein n=1 Tax=Linum trigynum TaxID=586398 RepID=A0AAV2ENS5_9ROSI
MRSPVLLVIIMSLRNIQPASAAVSCSCNFQYFPYGDQRIMCVYHLIDKMVGDSLPVRKGAWYQDEDCVDSSIIYEAKDVLQNTYCHRRMGGRAWGTGCYMRFEIYPFN